MVRSGQKTRNMDLQDARFRQICSTSAISLQAANELPNVAPGDLRSLAKGDAKVKLNLTSCLASPAMAALSIRYINALIVRANRWESNRRAPRRVGLAGTLVPT
jgi:hypothetical protein